MLHSEQINEIAAAIAKAQGQIKGASKDANNPFFKSKYADLASVWDACRGALSANGLAVIQSPSADGMRVLVDTLLTHSSGQWIAGTVSVTAKEDTPQAIGSAITYLRRYALQSFVGVAPEDDDGNLASAKGSTVKVTPVAPKGYGEWLTDLEAVADQGTADLQKAWKKSKAEYRTHLTETNNAGWESIKAKAANAAKVTA
jgi:hypothetical protein